MKRFKADVIILCLLAMLVPLVVSPLPVQAGSNWTIDGDTVYINDSNAYLAATPAVLGGSGWVEFELLSKHYEGEIDAVWGFDASVGIRPSKPQIWKQDVPHLCYRMVDVEKSGNVTIYNVTSWKMLEVGSVEADIGNVNNTQLIELTLNQTGDFAEFYWPNPLVVAFNTYVKHSSSSATFFYTYDTQDREAYIEYYDDWMAFTSGAISKVQYNHTGFDDWRFVKLDAPIQKNVLYKVRCWVEIPFKGHDVLSGKYIWAVKPHSETLQQAILNGHLYMLDPWYNANWDYRETITIHHGMVNGTQIDFPVYIDDHDLSATFWANVQGDGEDVVFTGDDGTTKLKREMVTIDTTNETMEFHVKVPVLSGDVNTTLYLYYGNAAAAEVNDTDTWNAGYEAVYHMNDDPDTSHIKDSTANANNGTKRNANEPLEVAGTVGRAQDFDGGDDDVHFGVSDIGSDLNGASAVTLECVINNDDLPGAGAFRWLFGTRVHSARAGIEAYLYDANKLRVAGRSVTTDGYQYKDATFTTIVQKYVAGLLEFQNDRIKIYIDGGIQTDDAVTFGNNVYTLGTPTDIETIGADPKLTAGRYFNGLIDEVRISSTNREGSWISTTNNTLMSPATFYSVGTLELLTVPAVEASNPVVNGTEIELPGNVTSSGNGTCDEHGFVWDDESHPNPGDTAPAASDYDDYWTEGGGTGDLSHIINGLDELTTYCFRAYSHNEAGYAYSDEICFFTMEDGRVYFEVRPRLDEVKVTGLGVPTQVRIGVFYGYSLPIWTKTNNEELYFAICVPDRWDEESDIVCHVHTALECGNETNNKYRLNLTWEHVTPNEDVVPVTSNTVFVERTIYSPDQYECYLDWQHFDYDIDVGDSIKSDDILALRVRRVAASSNDTAGEIIILHVGFIFARGDLLGEPWNVILEEDMTILALMLLCLGLMIVGFVWKKQDVMVAGGLSWLVFAFWMRTITPTWWTWDVYEGLFWLGIAMVFLCFAEAMVLARKVPKEDIEAEDEDAYREEYGELQARIRRMRGKK